MTSRNDSLFERARQRIPAGVNSPVRAFGAVGGTPPFLERASGPHLWDADGKRYIDYVGSWGPMVLGHTHPAVVEAVQAAASKAVSFGAPTEAEVEIAELICRLVPSIEMVRLVSSGTEATMTAIRLARGYTGRSLIVKFEGCYHGHADSLLVKAGSGALTFGNPSSAGVPPETAAQTLVLEFNNSEQIEKTFAARGAEIACVIVEPVAGNMNLVLPAPGFLEALREQCTRHGAVLIFDEVMTGFRVALGGAQARYGIVPDLTTLGKVIGGGLPVGAVGGRRDILQKIAPLGPVYQAGTLSGNPVAVAAGLATLKLVDTPGFQERISRTTEQLITGLKTEAQKAQVVFSAQSIGSMFGLYFRASPPASFAEVMQCDKDRFNRFFHAMLERGVYLAPSAYEAGFVSAAHGAAEIDATLAAAREAFRACTARPRSTRRWPRHAKHSGPELINFSGRPVTLAPKGMVACPHALASQAGVEVLRAGGSAVDAAVAASGALAVLYPHMTGVGGDAFWLIYDARNDAVRYLDGGGRAAASADAAWFRAQGHSEIPFRGILPATLTTPGAVSSWVEAHREFGRLPLARDLEAAIGYAREGFPVGERLAGWIEATAPELTPHPESAAIFLPQGRAPRAGSTLVNANLARTLSALAEGGRAGFYEGEVARELARFSQERGGFFDAADLRAQAARWGEPIKGSYRDVTIFETPAPTQGFTVLEMLNLLEPFELHRKPYLGADAAHLMVQAKQIAYHDRDRHLADPRFSDVPMERLISKAYADARRGLIDPQRALAWDRIPSYGSLTGDTVFIAAVDGEGNAAALINSLYGVFGSCVVAGDTGVVLQNRSAYFSLDPAHPNCVAPGKTPLHTLIASLAFRGGRLWGVVGCMGADGQPQIHAQTYVSMIDYGRDIQEAVQAPRWLSGRFALGEARDTLHIEARFPPQTIDELARRGHTLDRWGDWNELAGHAHGIVIDPASGMRMGGADPRSDGAAIGY